jgi:hypothetical protein
MLQSVFTLDCPTPSGQPLCRERVRENGRTVEISPQSRSLKQNSSMITGRAQDRRADGLKIGSADAVMVDLCLRPEGVSRPELREALGWKSDPYPSLVSACDKAGIALDMLRHVEPFRYCGRYQLL